MCHAQTEFERATLPLFKMTFINKKMGRQLKAIASPGVGLKNFGIPDTAIYQ